MSGTRVFDHVLIIMFENEYRSYVLHNDYMRQLASQGVNLTGSFGVMHPSQTNYVASVAGQLCNVTYDSPSPPDPLLSEDTIVKGIEAAPLTWKGYMDSLKQDDAYATRHNPFALFESTYKSSNIVDGLQFWRDVNNGDLPNYAWFTPNLWNDGHYLAGGSTTPNPRAPVLVDQLAAWLEYFFKTLRFPGPDSRLPDKTLVVVTFDEADYEDAFDTDRGAQSNYDGPNQICTLLLGEIGKAQPGSAIDTGFNHYSLIRTIEENFSIKEPLQANNAAASWYRFLWGEALTWKTPDSTGPTTSGDLALGALGDTAYLVFLGDEGRLMWWEDPTSFSEPAAVGVTCAGMFALAAVGEKLVLAYQPKGGDGLSMVTYSSQGGWSAPSSIVSKTSISHLAATSFTPEFPTGTAVEMMLAYSDDSGTLYYVTYDGSTVSPPASIGYTAAGALALATLGPTVYLVYVGSSDGRMLAVLYNTASYNVVTPSTSPPTVQYTTCNAWSASAYPVGPYYAAKYATIPIEKQPRETEYATAGQLAMACLDGSLYLIYPKAGGTELFLTTMSVSGCMASKYPTVTGVATSHPPPDYDGTPATSSNSFGTFAEAGWSLESPFPAVSFSSRGALTIAEAGSKLILVSRTAEDQLECTTGTWTIAPTT